MEKSFEIENCLITYLQSDNKTREDKCFILIKKISFKIVI